MTELELKNKKVNTEKLVSFGFALKDGVYTYSRDIADGSMKLNIAIHPNGRINTEIIDNSSEEEYVLHLVSNSEGEFVGRVRMEYEAILDEISQKCYETQIFKQEQTKRVIQFVRNEYGDELEFLWKKFDDNAIWRRNDNQKWYGAILTVSKTKLGLQSEDIAEIIDLRIQPELMNDLLAKDNYYPGWHMNKKHWFTVILDGSIPDEILFEHIRTSYMLAKNGKL